MLMHRHSRGKYFTVLVIKWNVILQTGREKKTRNLIHFSKQFLWGVFHYGWYHHWYIFSVGENQKKYEKYWPDLQLEATFGKFKVLLLTENHYAFYIVRRMKVTFMEVKVIFCYEICTLSLLICYFSNSHME